MGTFSFFFSHHITTIEGGIVVLNDPGLTDLLQKLRDAGIRCAVGSSGYKPNVDFVLEKCRIEPYFDARISGGKATSIISARPST